MNAIARLCACLPLALAVAAARAGARPRLPLTTLAGELRDSASRLDVLDAGDPASSVRAVFSWSYRQLRPDPARMFRLLGIHPGPDITAAAAASLAGTGAPEARRLLAGLTRAHLTTEHLPGRWALHDLLRAYANEQARAADDQQTLQEAAGRVLDHYLHTACAAATLINPARDPITLPPCRPGVTAEQVGDHRQALSWFEAERKVLLAAITLAASTGSDIHAWQLPWAMADFLNRRGHWNDQVAIQVTAVAAATRRGDTAGQAVSLRSLAGAREKLGDDEQARADYEACLTLYRQLDDRLGEAKVHEFLGGAAENQGRYGEALSHDEQALRLYQAGGDRPGEERILNNVGWIHALLGDYEQARVFCQQALTLSADLGHRYDEAFAWDSLGYAEYHLGQLTEAAACYQRALSLFREFGDRYFEATSLSHLGDTRQAAGEQQQAVQAWQQALAILDDLQHTDAGQVRAKLAGAPGHPGTRPRQRPRRAG
jgi:tetratricopeptide (TPR) repeat protein